MEIKDKIMSSDDNYLAASMIVKALPYAKAEMMCRIYKDLERYISNKCEIECIENCEEEAKSYYCDGKNSYPSLNFIIPVKDESIRNQLVFRIEIDHKLYCGVCGWFGSNNWEGKKTEELEKYISEYLNPIHSKRKTAYWYWWEYLDEEINFRLCNEAYSSLYNQEKYESFLKNVYCKLDEYIIPILMG